MQKREAATLALIWCLAILCAVLLEACGGSSGGGDNDDPYRCGSVCNGYGICSPAPCN